MSVEKAKEAVQCDVKDGISWCEWTYYKILIIVNDDKWQKL